MKARSRTLNRKNLPLLVFVGSLALLAASTFWILRPTTVGYTLDHPLSARTADRNIGAMLKGTVVEQPFTVAGTPLALAIRFDTFARTNATKVEIRVLDANRAVVLDETVDATILQDGAYFRVALPTSAELKDGSRLILQLESLDGTTGDSVSVWSASDGTLDVAYTSGYHATGYFSLTRVVLCSLAWILTLLSGLYLLALRKDRRSVEAEKADA